jgi:Queuine tRNA-ribosyltransferase
VLIGSFPVFEDRHQVVQGQRVQGGRVILIDIDVTNRRRYGTMVAAQAAVGGAVGAADETEFLEIAIGGKVSFVKPKGQRAFDNNLQTLNGRVQVTHDDYRQMAASSSSFAAILPLFEHPPDDSRPPKHVMERNFEWTVAALVGHDPSRNGDGGGSPTTAVWLPVSVCGIVAAAATSSTATAPPPPRTRGIVGDHGRDDDDHHHHPPTDDLQELVDDVCQWMANLDEPLRRRLSHVCLVDWHLVPEETTRRQQTILDAFDEKLPASLGLAVLAVDTVEQLSLAMQFAQTTSRRVTIGTSLPTKLAQQCRALTLQRPRNAEGPTEQKKIKLDPITATVANPFDKSAAAAFSSTVTLLQATDPVSAHPWFQDAGPIDDDCSCRTCQDHSRSYLYHLACSNELLVEILLFVHNLHQILHAT